MSRYISRLYIVVEADSEAEACDAMSACLSETLKYDGHIVEWGYTSDGEFYSAPREVAPEYQSVELDPADVSYSPSLDVIWSVSA